MAGKLKELTGNPGGGGPMKWLEGNPDEGKVDKVYNGVHSFCPIASFPGSHTLEHKH